MAGLLCTIGAEVSTATMLVGDVYERLAELPDGSVDLVITSPPFLALRSYLPADHPDKHKEIGSEPTPAAFLDTLLALTAEWRRVLAPHGSLCVELGDTYSGSGGGGGDYNADGLRDGQPRFDGSGRRVRETRREGYILNGVEPPAHRDTSAGWPLAKSLCGIPHLYHLSLAYGRNLLTGQPSPAGQLRVRNVVAWCRPNPPVGALGDKFRPATSYMTIACVSGQRYFDLDAVREQVKHPDARFTRENENYASTNNKKGTLGAYDASQSAGAPPLDYWEIPTHPFKGAHYAAFPPALLTRPILAMCPQRVCRVCGEPSRRIVGEAEYVPSASYRGGSMLNNSKRVAEGVNQWVGEDGASASVVRNAPTLGWTDCGCSDDGSHWRNGLVLDPFGGSGTTAAVATGMGRDCILIDLDSRNAELARERVGLFLTVDYGTKEGVA